MSALTFHNEISQENNLNATAHLYIQEDGTVYKKYFNFNDLTKKNIENLLAIAEDPRLKPIQELALPIDIIKENGRTVGYTMPYYSGRTMLDHIADEAVPFDSKLSCFKQLASVITQLPEGVFVGDLHMKNVIVDQNGKIHLIDIDGFSVSTAYLLSCPMSRLILEDARFDREKYRSNGRVTVSKNTDILCFFDAFLYLILGKIFFTMYSHKCLESYLDHLKIVSFPEELVEDIRLLFSDSPNHITLTAFDKIDAENADRYSFKAYSDFVRESSAVKNRCPQSQ